MELNLRFPDPTRVIVRLGNEDSGTLPFTDPFQPADHKELRWYIET